MLAVDRTLRERGSPGFETQMHLVLGGPVDVERLRGALGALAARYPVLAARLATNEGGVPEWQTSAAECVLQEATLTSSTQEAVLECAARILSAAAPLEVGPPIRFQLLHRPDGRDVLLVQYNHTLMDNNAAVLVGTAIDAAFRQGKTAVGERAARSETCSMSDPLRRYLRRFPRSRRRQATRDTIQIWRRAQRGGVVTLGRRDAPRPEPVRYWLASRSLDAAATRAWQARVVDMCGFPSFSMGLLASVFRAVARLAPADDKANLCAGIGVDLGLRGQDDAIFHNLMSLVPVHCGRADVTDRAALVRELSRQFRQRLAADMDLGVLQLATLFSRRSQYAQWALDVLFRHTFSLWYGYFGNLDALGEKWCDTEIESVTFAGPAWSPLGLTLLANQHRGRLLLQATSIPEVVSDALVNAFLDNVLADLSTAEQVDG